MAHSELHSLFTSNVELFAKQTLMVFRISDSAHVSPRYTLTTEERLSKKQKGIVTLSTEWICGHIGCRMPIQLDEYMPLYLFIRDNVFAAPKMYCPSNLHLPTS